MPTSLVEIVARAAQLLVRAILPAALSPEPPRRDDTFFEVGGALALLALLIASAAWARREDTRLARAGAALTWIAVAAALAGATWARGDDAPLLRAAPFVAPFAWAAIAASSAAIAARLGGARPARAAAAGVPLALGAALFVAAWPVLRSPAAMWADVLRRDPSNEVAVVAVGEPLARSRRPDEALAVSAACLAVVPRACPCLELRAEAAARKRSIADATSAARAAVEACPGRGTAFASLAEALAAAGDAAGAAIAAGRAVELGGPADRIAYAHALALELNGKLDEADAEAQRALAARPTRDTQLLAATVAIRRGELARASALLAPLVASSPPDVEAVYDLALVADRRDDFNAARQGYLAALRLDAKLGAARYNLALLTWRHGALEEARHHAARFAEANPGDGRAASLNATVRSPPP